jgi:hypothetical protein
LKIRIVVVGYLAACAMLSLTVIAPRLGQTELRPDLTVMWAAARAANPYDAIEVTSLQSDLRTVIGPLPFMYPPSSLPIFFPLGLLPFGAAFLAWTAISVGLFWSAARQLTKEVLAVFLAPHVVLAIVLGQTALIVGASVLWGTTLLRAKPFTAGLIFGLGAAIKPQSLILAPVAFASGRAPKAFAGMFIGWSMLALPTLPWWRIWIAQIPSYPSAIAYYDLYQYGATPSLLAKALNVSNAFPVLFVGAALGVCIVWLAFRSDDLVTRCIGLLSGTLIASPYALRYELAALVPPLVASLMKGTFRGAIAAIPILCMNVLTIVPAVIVSALQTILADQTRQRSSDSVSRT